MSETVASAPVTKSVYVDRDPTTAFRVFTTEIGSWWPLDTHALNPGDVREVVWEERLGGEVYEVSTAGVRCHWATVLVWEPASRLVIEWRVNPDRPATEVEVRFAPDGEGTRVELEHRGWERLGGEAAEARTGYDTGWDHVLGRFVARPA